MDEIISREVLEDAQIELNARGGDHTERLAKVLCILLSGVIERLLEEYEDDDA